VVLDGSGVQRNSGEVRETIFGEEEHNFVRILPGFAAVLIKGSMKVKALG
jgi:hypothetical protein